MAENAYSETSATQARSGTNYFKVYQAFNSQVNYTGVYQDYISGPGVVYSADGWAYVLSTDKPTGQNAVWLEVTFRDASANVLALYRSVVLTAASFTNGTFPVNTWADLPVTNQYNPNTFLVTNTTSQLTAPAGTYFVRYQVVFQGDAANSGGSMYFDDLNLAPAGGPPYGSWNIIWSDEFNGTTVNTNIWDQRPRQRRLQPRLGQQRAGVLRPASLPICSSPTAACTSWPCVSPPTATATPPPA